MTKAEFSKICEATIKDLFNKAREIDADIYGLTIHLAKCDKYESFDVHAYREDISDSIAGKHFVSILENGGKLHTEEVA